MTVGGTKVSGTERINEQESSANQDEMPIMITCKISPNGSQVVVVEWKQGGGTVTAHERTMNLIPVAAGDIFEAVGTADDTDNTTTDKQIDDMVILVRLTILIFFLVQTFMGRFPTTLGRRLILCVQQALKLRIRNVLRNMKGLLITLI